MTVLERFQGANVVDAGRLSPYWGEHAARYVFALPFVDRRTVLDIACGTGYGISILAERAKHIVGVDVDPQAAAEARSQGGENSAVLLADGLNLPFVDNSFDVITSFETLEHLHGRAKFLSELGRVLRPSGMLVLSTPNALYTRPVKGKPANPFHVHEYEPEELREELGQQFIVERFWGQSLDPSIAIPPFYDAQQRLPNELSTQVRLLSWKAFNKLPFKVRERLSEMIWGKPFYPTEMDYNFDDREVKSAPVLVALCRKQ
jgi:SAM-dependent methyltransferase